MLQYECSVSYRMARISSRFLILVTLLTIFTYASSNAPSSSPSQSPILKEAATTSSAQSSRQGLHCAFSLLLMLGLQFVLSV